ncbi:galactitol-specific phosphotransferase system IIC component [Halarchaeum solikamskense]|nr:galactitol-specific phosphotransferase system IIC component [Halarchaeum solikamskense]
MKTSRSNGSGLRSRIGIIGESILIGTVLLAALTAVLYINGNTLQFSSMAGIVLGTMSGLCRYLIQSYRS